MLYVGDVVPERAGDVIDLKLVSILLPSGVDGDTNRSRVNRVRREKIPFLGSH